MAVRVHRVTSVLLWQTDNGNHLVFYFRALFYRWIVDLFLIPSMDRQADFRYRSGDVDYNITWVLLTFLGLLGIIGLYGQVVYGDHLSVIRGYLRVGLSLRPVDLE